MFFFFLQFTSMYQQSERLDKSATSINHLMAILGFNDYVFDIESW